MNEQENMIPLSEAPVENLYSHPLAKAYLSKVYAWMAASMAVTAGMAVYAAHNDNLMMWLMQHPWLPIIGTFVVILLMFFCSGILTSGALGVLLLAYAGLTGLLFGPLLLIFTQQSLGTTFACTAGTFAVMSMYGMFTKRDLSPWGRALMMGLFGLIIALVVNCFWGNGMFDLLISAAGVLIFTLLTAYDTQKILREGLVAKGEERSKGAILGALVLYLDFINLFLYLLRFLGDRK